MVEFLAYRYRPYLVTSLVYFFLALEPIEKSAFESTSVWSIVVSRTVVLLEPRCFDQVHACNSLFSKEGQS
jgi:hypothetical protein